MVQIGLAVFNYRNDGNQNYKQTFFCIQQAVAKFEHYKNLIWQKLLSHHSLMKVLLCVYIVVSIFAIRKSVLVQFESNS